MPSRSVVLLILAFWVCTTAWFVRRDLWPRLRRGDPPPFAIDLVDEAQITRPKVRWLVTRGKVTRAGAASQTSRISVFIEIRYDPRMDLFYSEAQARSLERTGLLSLERINSSYAVTREGNVRGFRASLEFDIGGKKGERLTAQGEVREGECQITWGQGAEPLSVEVSPRGLVLLPWHPPNRMPGLTPGRVWVVPFLDLLDSSTRRTHLLRAEVAGATEKRRYSSKEYECWLVNYQSNEVSGRTWVRTEDGLVMESEFCIGDDRWVVVRD